MKQRRLPPVWVMGLTNATFGLMGGFAVVTLPEMLAAQGIPGGHIAAITALVLSPTFWVFVIAPMLDVRFSRRSYALLFGALTALAAGFTVMHHSNVDMVKVVMVTGYTCASLYQGAVGGWMGSLIGKEHDSRLGMWFAISNVGSGGLMILLAGGIVHRLSALTAALVLGGMILLPMLLFLFIPAPGPDRMLARESFGQFWKSVGALLPRREVLVALALFMLPSASFALSNVLGGVGKDFSASEHLVSLFAGVGTTVAGIAGSLLQAPLARRFSLRPLYLGIGIVGAACTLGLLLLPRTPWTFGLAFTDEAIFQALAFAVANAIIFEVIGPGNPLASTVFTLLTSAMCLPITYMGFLDGWGYDWRGLTGSFVTDALISAAACMLLAIVLRRFWTSRNRRYEPSVQAQGSVD